MLTFLFLFFSLRSAEAEFQGETSQPGGQAGVNHHHQMRSGQPGWKSSVGQRWICPGWVLESVKMCPNQNLLRGKPKLGF